MNIYNTIQFLSIEPHTISALKIKTLFANWERKISRKKKDIYLRYSLMINLVKHYFDGAL